MGLFGSDSDSGSDDDFASQHEAMVDRLIEHGRIANPAVADALRTVPRHEFVPEGRRSEAYADRPLPIGDGQTISAPHMVGIMVELLDIDLGTGARPDSEAGDEIGVLEIGTGCGYHAAVTAAFLGDAGTVYSVEYSEQLADRARTTFDRLGYDVRVRVGDGAEGWPANAPYEAAYLTCAAESLPEPIAKQTTVGGRIVAPIGTGSQTLYRYTKREDGGLDGERHGGVRFVQMR